MNGFGSMLKDYLDYYKISQTDFADRIGVSSKHMNEILNENTNISESVMLAISLITDIDINLIFYVENKKRIYEYLNKKYKTEKEIKAFLNSYYINEMHKKEWITLKDKTSVVQNTIDLLDYLSVKNFEVLDNYLSKRVLYKKSDSANMKKIYLWIKHCDKIIENQEVEPYNSSNLSKLLEELKIERNKKFNEENLIKLFNKYGIYLSIEDALEGTKLRGCMMVKGTNPAIYMTKYLKDKASFYYALYHELSHIKTDYNKAKNKIIIDEEIDKLEKRADEFALDQMIDNKVWEEILNNYSKREEICKKSFIPLSFLYSKLAYLGYIKYSSEEYNNHKEKIY